MKGGIGNLMKQAQKMQEDMQKAQQEIAEMQIEGNSGGGLVSVIMNGRHELHKVSIDDSLMGDDKEMLEDLLAAAVNDAVQRLEAASKDKLGGLTAGMNLPSVSNCRFSGQIMAGGLLQELIESLRCLPGVGPKSAQRMAFHLLQRDRSAALKLGEVMQQAMQEIQRCKTCRNFTEQPQCRICSDWPSQSSSGPTPSSGDR